MGGKEIGLLCLISKMHTVSDKNVNKTTAKISRIVFIF